VTGDLRMLVTMLGLQNNVTLDWLSS